MGLRALFSLERPQEIDDFLLLLSAQLIETFDDFICLAATAPVSSDGVYQVVGPSFMEEEDTLSDVPEGSCSEVVGAAPACLASPKSISLAPDFITTPYGQAAYVRLVSVLHSPKIMAAVHT
jgi:hypothetical protein